MDANTVTAICATIIALLSLTISFLQARAVRQHNRYAVRPLLELWTPRRHGGKTGVQLINQGLGPAIITRTILKLDGQVLGGWDEPTVDRMRESLPTRPRAMTIRPPRAIPTGFDSFLLSLDDFDREQHAWFADLIKQRIQIEIHYESLYGGEDFKAALHVDRP
ncbi:hypothetical protein [Actinomadura sp. 7K507]|uniref:hypothetical protein n=1 Tax=Actinomadura sp. 7K507 TaxID=2530365 RepID=UPI0010435228|nr:hypothetical protein [Actinomadura sp. 7K507]TDC97494.1 hypothetical protein E1285_03510 [Actinomadura sp. 7K507]